MALLTLVDPSFSQYTNAKLREGRDRDWAKTGGHCILPLVGLAGLSAGLAAVRLYNVVPEGGKTLVRLDEPEGRKL